MQTKTISLSDTDINEAAKEAGKVLRSGGTVAFPTDTVYGLGAVYSDREAVKSIFAAKGRPSEKPLSILVSDMSQVYDLAEDVSEDAGLLMRSFWPGAVTLIFKKKSSANIPDEVTAGGDTIGVRMPASDIAKAVINAAGAPLAAPSANISGSRSAVNASEVIEDLYGKTALIIDGGDCPVGISSTVIDMSGKSERGAAISILREGSVNREMIEKALKGIK